MSAFLTFEHRPVASYILSTHRLDTFKEACAACLQRPSATPLVCYDLLYLISSFPTLQHPDRLLLDIIIATAVTVFRSLLAAVDLQLLGSLVVKVATRGVWSLCHGLEITSSLQWQKAFKREFNFLKPRSLTEPHYICFAVVSWS